MSTRRQFIAGAALVAASTVAGALPAKAAVPSFAGVLFTAANPGYWAGKEKTHAPQVTLEGMKATVLTPHGMSEAHFIVRHTIVAADGKLIGAATFTAKDKPESMVSLPGKGVYYATSFCNLHDMWVTEFTV